MSRRRAEPDRPSASEVRTAHREFLAEEGCHKCGHDDPDDLTAVGVRTHSCRARQTPSASRTAICVDCKADRRSYREQILADARDDDGVDVVVFYECDYPVKISYSRPQVETPAGELVPRPHTQPNADVPVLCRCGQPIDRIEYLADGVGE
jgi:hypothetical protein